MSAKALNKIINKRRDQSEGARLSRERTVGLGAVQRPCVLPARSRPQHRSCEPVPESQRENPPCWLLFGSAPGPTVLSCSRRPHRASTSPEPPVPEQTTHLDAVRIWPHLICGCCPLLSSYTLARSQGGSASFCSCQFSQLEQVHRWPLAASDFARRSSGSSASMDRTRKPYKLRTQKFDEAPVLCTARLARLLLYCPSCLGYGLWSPWRRASRLLSIVCISLPTDDAVPTTVPLLIAVHLLQPGACSEPTSGVSAAPGFTSKLFAALSTLRRSARYGIHAPSRQTLGPSVRCSRT